MAQHVAHHRSFSLSPRRYAYNRFRGPAHGGGHDHVRFNRLQRGWGALPPTRMRDGRARLVANDRAVALYASSAEAEDARQQLGHHDSENTPVVRPRFQPPPMGSMRRWRIAPFSGSSSGRTADTLSQSIDLPSVRPKQSLIRDGPWWRRLMSEAPCRSSPFAEQSGLWRYFRTVGDTAPRLRSRVADHSHGRSLGNALNALVQSPEHTASGASTAIFGALGILSGYMRRSRVVPWRGGLRRGAPLGAGLTLLVLLGFSGERTDIGAHIAGFAMGGVRGFISTLPRIA